MINNTARKFNQEKSRRGEKSLLYNVNYYFRLTMVIHLLIISSYLPTPSRFVNNIEGMENFNKSRNVWTGWSKIWG